MSLEQAIHQRWAADPLLLADVPADRMSTGMARGDVAMPYAVLVRRENQAIARTSSGTAIDRAVVRFSVWSADLDQGKRIARSVARRFDRADFPLAAGGVLNMQRLSETENQADDGAWRLDLDYTILHRHAT